MKIISRHIKDKKIIKTNHHGFTNRKPRSTDLTPLQWNDQLGRCRDGSGYCLPGLQWGCHLWDFSLLKLSFQFVSITTHPLNKHQCEEPDSTTLMEQRCCPMDTEGYCQVPLKQFPFSGWKSPGPSASPHTASAPPTPHHNDPPLLASHLMIPLLNWGGFKQDTAFQMWPYVC